jgi:hypothetical protein
VKHLTISPQLVVLVQRSLALLTTMIHRKILPMEVLHCLVSELLRELTRKNVAFISFYTKIGLISLFNNATQFICASDIGHWHFVS